MHNVIKFKPRVVKTAPRVDVKHTKVIVFHVKQSLTDLIKSSPKLKARA